MNTVAAPAPSHDTTTLQREIERLRNDLHRLRTDFADLTDDALHTARQGASDARDRIHQNARDVLAKGRESIHAVEGQIKTHPFTSVAAALAVGVLLGVAVSRSRRD